MHGTVTTHGHTVPVDVRIDRGSRSEGNGIRVHGRAEAAGPHRVRHHRLARHGRPMPRPGGRRVCACWIGGDRPNTTKNARSAADPQPHEIAWTLTNAVIASRSLHVIAELGVADQISGEPVGVEHLAAACGADTDGKRATFDHLEHSVVTGSPAMEVVEAGGLWPYLRGHPREGKYLGRL